MLFGDAEARALPRGFDDRRSGFEAGDPVAGAGVEIGMEDGVFLGDTNNVVTVPGDGGIWYETN